mgnify:FL=1
MARDTFDVDSWLAGDLARDARTYTIDAARGIVQTDGSASDHANAMEMARTLLELRQIGNVEALLPPRATSAASAPSSAGGKTLREAISYWETVDMTAMRLAATASERRKAIEDFAAYVGEKRAVAEIRKPDVAAWIVYLRGTKKNEQSTAKKGFTPVFTDTY